MSKILVVDDEQSICWGFVQLGKSMGHDVQTAASAEEGLKLAERSAPDLLVLDVRLPGMDGLSALEHFRRHMGTAPIIVITAFGALDIAVRAVRSGAFDYIIKPFSLAEVRSAIERALRSTERVHAAAPAELHGEMVGSTPQMQSLFKRLALAAASDANVLIRGESGVGKELAARAIHRYSSRADARFVAVNMAALSPALAESELFGHVEGSFTGASRARDGLLVQADGGTLFLDEVADIPLPLQIKLLRALEQREVLPVGADRTAKASFRVVAASHQDLKARVLSGAFRHDLFFRLCAFEIAIPALRERPDDIPLLAAYFVSQIGDGSLSLAENTIEEMQERPWYGNVRELRNAVEHAAVVARSGVILPEHLPDPQPCFEQGRNFDQEPCFKERPDFDQGSSGRRPAVAALAAASSSRADELLSDPDSAGAVYQTLLEEVEAPLLRNAMQRFDNECAPAARALGLHRTTLRKKLLQHRIGEGE